jgi:DNA mismatch repair protein MutS
MDSMFTQYLAWYQRHQTKYGPNTAVLMQVGKFFEIYDRLNLITNSTHTNIREIADLCSLNLSEALVDETTMKLCGGFPEQSLPKFERQLLDSGYTVVIVVQKKNSRGDVEERTVERISSPGIYENRYSSFGKSENDSCLVGLLIEKNDAKSFYVGVTAVNIQTGNTWTTETNMQFLQNTPNIDNLEPFFLMHAPAECVCWFSDELVITESEVRSWFHLSLNTVVHLRKGKHGKPNTEFMKSAFSIKSSLQPHIALGLEKYHQAYNCMGLTLGFIEEHIPSLLKKLRNNNVWIPENRVRLGNAALEQLNIISASNECLLFFYQKTFTALGRRALRERLITPISDIEELQRRFSRIDFLREFINSTDLEKNLRSVYDLGRLHRKLHLLSVSYTDIQHLLLTYTSINELVCKFQNTSISIESAEIVKKWFHERQSIWSLERIKTSDPAILRRTHPWIHGIYPEMDIIETNWHELIDEIQAFLKPFNENTPITFSNGETLPFEFTITKKRFEKLDNTIFKFHQISAKSSSGILDSHALTEFQKRGLQIQKLWTSTQDIIWLKCLEDWSKYCDIGTEEANGVLPISDIISNWIGNLDVEFALARCAHQYNLITPTFIESDTSKVKISELRHPIIEQIHTGSPYIRHSLALGYKQNEDDLVGNAESGLLVYGSNSSGKSSLMKALGIAVICAQSGIPVAASTMTLSPYKSVFTRILGNDNLWASLSSFAVEMTEFRAILKYANKNSLILGDELCSGTETRSATAIVSAGIQTMVKRGAQFLLATHLHEISEQNSIRIMNSVKFTHLGIEYDSSTKTIVYKRTLQEGPGSSLYGLEVCYGLDMDPEFLELANQCRENLGKTSRYNSQVQVKACEICHSEKDLESHHIIYQASAKNGFVEPGIRTHRESNLTVLCGLCHTEHHNNNILIEGWIDTSTGRKLKWSRPEKKIESEPSVINKFELIKTDLKILIMKQKKEKEIQQNLENTFGFKIKLTEIRSWKKDLINS